MNIQSDEAKGLDRVEQCAVGVREVGGGEGHDDQPEVREDQVEEEHVAREGVEEEGGEEESNCQDGLWGTVVLARVSLECHGWSALGVHVR